MSSASFSSTNPNSYGGSFNYDGRSGLGIGSLSGGPQKGIGSNWNMGDALSSPKGEWDKELKDNAELSSNKINSNTTVKELAILAGLIEDNNEEDFNKFDAGIESKAHTSYQRRATDSRAKKGTDISSLGGLGNTVANVIGIHSSHNIEGDIVIESILRDFLALEVKNQISGNIIVKPKGKPSGSTNTADAAPVGHLPVGRHGFNYKGHDQEEVDVFIKTSKGHIKIPMQGTTDGAETIRSSSSDIDFLDYDDGKTSSYEILDKTSDQDFLDSYHVSSKNKRFNIYK